MPLVEVAVSRLFVDASNRACVVVLQDRETQRVVPIWIGEAEASSIGAHLTGKVPERPLTHDLCKLIIEGMGGTLRAVHVTRVQNNTYFAELHIEAGDRMARIDARPSDSIAIAVRFRAPIYVEESLLVILKEDDEEETELSFGTPPEAVQADEELSAEQLKAYLEQLRPEDFGKFNP